MVHLARDYFNLKEKENLVAVVDGLVSMGAKIMPSCAKHGFTAKQYRMWKSKMSDITAGHKKALTTHKGPAFSIRDDVIKQLLKWLHDERDHGWSISIQAVSLKAAKLDKEFGKKTAQARYFVVRRLLIHYGYSLRRYTHESQRCPLHVVTEAAGFIRFMRSIVALPHVHPDFVINMDQTGVFFCMTRKTTIAKRGTKTVKVRTTDKNRCTLAMTVTASGRMLRPLVVFKGTENGRIEGTRNIHERHGIPGPRKCLDGRTCDDGMDR
jgi:hypothetical protein